MIQVNQKEIARLFGVTRTTIADWTKKKDMPVKDGYYDVQECFKWKYGEDWVYFYNKVVGVCDEKTN